MNNFHGFLAIRRHSIREDEFPAGVVEGSRRRFVRKLLFVVSFFLSSFLFFFFFLVSILSSALVRDPTRPNVQPRDTAPFCSSRVWIWRECDESRDEFPPKISVYEAREQRRTRWLIPKINDVSFDAPRESESTSRIPNIPRSVIM